MLSTIITSYAAKVSLSLSTIIYSIGNTLAASLVCLLVAIPLGTLLSILLSRSDVWGRRWAAVALASQLAVPLYVFAGGWAAGIGLQGWLRIDTWLGPTAIGWMQGWLGRLLAVGLIHGLACVPWVCLIITIGLCTCNRNHEDSTLLEGGWAALIRLVWLPRLRGWLFVACLWCLLGLLTEMAVSNLYMFSTVAELIYQDVSRDTISPMTYLIAVLLCILPIIVMGYLLHRRLPPLSLVLDQPQYFRAYPISLGKHRLVLSLLVWIVLATIVGLPLFNLIVKAGWTPALQNDQVVGFTWTLQRFVQTLVESITLYQREFYWSMMMAVCSACVAALGSILLYGLSGSGTTWRKAIVHAGMFLLVATPGPMVGLLLTKLLNHPGWLGHLYDQSLLAPVLAQQARLLPLGWLLVCALAATVPARMWLMAQADGLDRWMTFKTVFLVHCWRRGLLAVILLWLVSLGELSCSQGVLPPGVTTLAMRLFEILHFGMRHQDSGLCGILIVLGWLAAFGMHWASTSSTGAAQQSLGGSEG